MHSVLVIENRFLHTKYGQVEGLNYGAEQLKQEEQLFPSNGPKIRQVSRGKLLKIELNELKAGRLLPLFSGR